MSGKQKTHVAAFGLLFFAVANATFMLFYTQESNVTKISLRLAFATIFAFSLIKRATWARYFVAIVNLIGTILSIFFFVGVSQSPGATLTMGFFAWSLIMTIFHLWLVYALMLDKDVAAYFKGTDESEKLT